ncbi:MAG: T9SS type A sorting domain-containing protein [Fibrobacteres bacterium]|nr:T9SS type A sorting domain-containing protein [Fibrobacterota bacterium]
MKPRFTYTYDPSRMDWDSLRISNHSEQGGGAQGTQIIETDSGVVCWSDSKLFRLNYNSRIWEKLNTTGVAVPAVVVDRDGAVYEPKRNRILFFKYASPVSVQSYNLETEILTNVTTVNSAVAVINNNNFREVVYLPDQDILFFGGKNSGAHLIYDCSSERFDTVRIEPSTLFTGGYSTGLMYDAKRKIIWQVDQKLEINAMRPQNLMTLLEKQKAGCSFKPFLRAIPNPFNPSSNLSFSLPIEKSGILEVFNAYGVLIRKLYEGQLGAGNHQIEWNGRDDFGRKVSAGLYVVRLTLGKESLNTRIIFAK